MHAVNLSTTSDKTHQISSLGSDDAIDSSELNIQIFLASWVDRESVAVSMHTTMFMVDPKPQPIQPSTKLYQLFNRPSIDYKMEI